MKSLKISQLKSGLSEALRWVRQGNEIVVTDHNEAIAKLVSVRKVPPLPTPKNELGIPSVKLNRNATSSPELIRILRDEE